MSGLSAVSKWVKWEEVTVPHCVIGSGDWGVQRRVRWGKVGLRVLPYILSRS